MRHVVRRVCFVPGTNDGPLACSCGAGMVASEFDAHRASFGHLGRRPIGPPADYRVTSVWRKTSTCVHGHPYTPENTYMSPVGKRQCKVCRQANHRRYMAHQQEAFA